MHSLPGNSADDTSRSLHASARPGPDAVSAKVRTPVSPKASSQGEQGADDGTLARVADLANRARGKGEHDRKQLAFPRLRRTYADGESYYLDVWDYLQAWAFRTLNDLQGAGYLRPSREQLAALFAARIRERGRTWHPVCAAIAMGGGSLIIGLGLSSGLTADDFGYVTGVATATLCPDED